jgi:hypothetical protein
MASTSLRFEDILDGALNFLSWKVRVTLLLEENDLWDIVKNVATPPIDPQELVAHNKRVVKCQEDDLGCHKGSLNPSCIQEEDNEGDVDALVKSLPESEHKQEDDIAEQTQIHSDDQIRQITSYLMKIT